MEKTKDYGWHSVGVPDDLYDQMFEQALIRAKTSRKKVNVSELAQEALRFWLDHQPKVYLQNGNK